MSEQHKQAPSPEIIKFLRDSGMIDQAEKLEKQFGISLSDIDKHLNQFITQDPFCLELKKQVRALSVHDDAVLIQGETGTGKELIARALHGSKKGPFIAINCAGMPRELVESELFGHAAGAFTGAKNEQLGLIAIADSGTLFLDEVGDLPLDLQAKLLRVIQERRIRKVGGKMEETINTRFVAATHVNLLEAVKLDKFRKDLYARLSTFELKIPPLRARLDDIPLIIESLEPTKPTALLNANWKDADLSLNVRTVQQVVRRWQVFNKVMFTLNGSVH